MSYEIVALPVRVSVIAISDILPVQWREGKDLLLVCNPQGLVC